MVYNNIQFVYIFYEYILVTTLFVVCTIKIDLVYSNNVTRFYNQSDNLFVYYLRYVMTYLLSTRKVFLLNEYGLLIKNLIKVIDGKQTSAVAGEE